MRQMVDAILRQYGTFMIVRYSDDGRILAARAFFQPVRSKNWQNAAYMATPLGEISRGQYVYIGPVDTPVSEGDALEIGEKSYFFRRVEPYYYGDEKVYIWGLCVEKGVNDTWGSQS